MTQPLRLVLALHNHQPVGNFDGVFEQAYRESYRPFLDVFDGYPDLKFSLHVSGCLMEWLDQHHPEYIERLAELVRQERIEILGGAFYEAILPLIPSRDRVGQIQRFSAWLHERLGAEVQGMWMPERVWEQCLVSDLADAGIRYTILDDFHFRAAGLAEDALHGYYVSEDAGKMVSIFPGSERLRYLIPFADPGATMHYLGEIARRRPGTVVVFGDDGEKFGSWPDTQKHIYEDGWLRRFFDALCENQHWIKTTTLAEAIENVPPTGKIYLPDCSYREMTEWALPVKRIQEYDSLHHELEKDSRWPRLQSFMRGGFWRNFRVKYPEADEMYTRMIGVSDAIEEARQQGADREKLEYARTELYRAQCNCAHWHGAFGGIYLPHLRNAVYNHLIAAENLLHEANARFVPWVEAEVGDHNLDARMEVALSNDKLVALLAPARGGQMYELDVRSICVNLLATLARREEAYHEKVQRGPSNSNGQVASIHDRVVFKQAGLDRQLQYDSYLRKSLIDHFYDNNVLPAQVARSEAMERGDFVHGVFECKLRRSPERIQVQLARTGNAWGHPLKITKAVTAEAGSETLTIAYLLEDLPPEPLHFAVEFNFAALPGGADDRYFHLGGTGSLSASDEQLGGTGSSSASDDSRAGKPPVAPSNRLGRLETRLDLEGATSLNLLDEWLGIDVGLTFSHPTGLWTFPVETVSQSEGGFELVHQSVCVLPHWLIVPDAAGKWSVTMELKLDTALAESRMGRREEVVAV